LVLVSNVLTQIGRRAGQQTHALDEADLAVACLPFDPPPVLQHETVTGLQQGFDLARAERVVAERDADVEIKHRIQPQPRLAAFDTDTHLRPWPRLPPVGDAHRQSAVLQLGNALQQRVGACRQPSARLVDFAAVHQLAQPRHLLCRLLHGGQQAQQRVAVVGSGVLLQRLAQRQVP